MTPEDLQALVALGREQRHVEFKSAGSLEDKNLRAKVFRAIMAMANLRDGGTVVVGVTEGADGLEPTGLPPDLLETWDASTLADRLRKYADPQPEFVLEHVEWDGRWFVALSVRQFSVTPVLCSADYNEVDGSGKPRPLLRAGACYVRTQGSKPESREVPTHADMRELIDLAVAKGVRRFVETASDAGLRIRSPGPTPQEINAKRVRTFFNETASDLHLRGFWRVEIYPAEDVVPAKRSHELIALMEQCRVDARGTSYPSYEALDREHRKLADDWLSVEYLEPFNKESWRLWRNGAFAHERALWVDWADENFGKLDPEWTPLTQLKVEETVYFVTEVFEFAARLCQTSLGCPRTVVRVELPRLHQRRLVMEPGRLRRRYTSMSDSWRSPEQAWDREELIDRRRDLAIETVQDLLLCFDWKPSIEVLRSIQEQIREFRTA